MPDAALRATERQFNDLLRAAARDVTVELRLFALADIERGDRIRRAMRGRYADARTLPGAELDGLIVTGTEPRTANLADEPYWTSLTRVIDWAERAAIPVIWSCLAAHAAVQHLDGIMRRPLAKKLSGVFACHWTAGAAALAGSPASVRTPHSRQNELREADLTAAGYRILTKSAVAGVDSFIRPGRAAWLFLQGHPEYDAESLPREYCRDVGRFLRGERPTHPETPVGCLDAATDQALAELAERARARRDPSLLPAYEAILNAARTPACWRPDSVRLYEGWLDHLTGAASQGRPATDQLAVVQA
jgi:homoserine O-succinyltransferase